MGDSRGVRRVKEDATFNCVAQAIEALYNPQFTKYPPSAINFERIILGQWVSNAAQIGTEAGGTGTLRRFFLQTWFSLALLQPQLRAKSPSETKS